MHGAVEIAVLVQGSSLTILISGSVFFGGTHKIQIFRLVSL